MTNSQKKSAAGLVFVTGSTGFVGKKLISYLSQNNIQISAGVRNLPEQSTHHINLQWVKTGDLLQQTEFSFLKEVSAVVHLAARVHRMKETSTNPLAKYRQQNVDLTIKLAKAAKLAGVKKFIFLSSIKVNGEKTEPGKPFLEASIPKPVDPYGISKLEAEKELLQLHVANQFEVIIIRPPLVYGDKAQANLKTLTKLISFGLPLPFKNISNKRSLVNVLNLCDLVLTCLKSKKNMGKVFFVSDKNAYSLPELIYNLSQQIQKKPILFSFPQSALKFILKLLRLQSISIRLFGSLEIDNSWTCKYLNWTPPFSFNDNLNNIKLLRSSK